MTVQQVDQYRAAYTEAIAAYRDAATAMRRGQGATSVQRLKDMRAQQLERLRRLGEHRTVAFLEAEAELIDAITQRRRHGRDSPELVEQLLAARAEHREAFED